VVENQRFGGTCHLDYVHEDGVRMFFRNAGTQPEVYRLNKLEEHYLSMYLLLASIRKALICGEIYFEQFMCEYGLDCIQYVCITDAKNRDTWESTAWFLVMSSNLSIVVSAPLDCGYRSVLL
jgi:hypothetical protein